MEGVLAPGLLRGLTQLDLRLDRRAEHLSHRARIRILILLPRKMRILIRALGLAYHEPLSVLDVHHDRERLLRDDR